MGISESCLQRWLRIADREDGLAPPASGDRGGGGKDESAELRELRRRNKLLARQDTAYVAGCLFRAIELCCHVLHSRAGQWLINEKVPSLRRA